MPKTPRITLPKVRPRLKEVREEKKMTLREVAEAVSKYTEEVLGVSTIQRYETATRPMTLDLLIVFANALEVPLMDLLPNPHRGKNDQEAILLDCFRRLKGPARKSALEAMQTWSPLPHKLVIEPYPTGKPRRESSRRKKGRQSAAE